MSSSPPNGCLTFKASPCAQSFGGRQEAKRARGDIDAARARATMRNFLSRERTDRRGARGATTRLIDWFKSFGKPRAFRWLASLGLIMDRSCRVRGGSLKPDMACIYIRKHYRALRATATFFQLYKKKIILRAVRARAQKAFVLLEETYFPMCNV